MLLHRYCDNNCANADWTAGHHKECLLLKKQAAAQAAASAQQKVAVSAATLTQASVASSAPVRMQKTAVVSQPSMHLYTLKNKKNGQQTQITVCPADLQTVMSKYPDYTVVNQGKPGVSTAHLVKVANPRIGSNQNVLNAATAPVARAMVQHGNLGKTQGGTATQAQVRPAQTQAVRGIDGCNDVVTKYLSVMNELLNTAHTQFKSKNFLPVIKQFEKDPNNGNKSIVKNKIETVTMAVTNIISVDESNPNKEEFDKVIKIMQKTGVTMKLLLEAIPAQKVTFTEVPKQIKELLFGWHHIHATVEEAKKLKTISSEDDAAASNIEKAEAEIVAARKDFLAENTLRQEAVKDLDTQLAGEHQKAEEIRNRLRTINETINDRKRKLIQAAPLMGELKKKLRLSEKQVSSAQLTKEVRSQDNNIVESSMNFVEGATEILSDRAAKGLAKSFTTSIADAKVKRCEADYFKKASDKLSNVPDALASKLSEFYTKECKDVAEAAAKEIQVAGLMKDCVVSDDLNEKFVEARSLIDQATAEWNRVRETITKDDIAGALHQAVLTSDMVLAIQPRTQACPIGWGNGTKRCFDLAGNRNSMVELVLDAVCSQEALQCVHAPALLEALSGSKEIDGSNDAFGAAATVSTAVDCVLAGSHRTGLCYVMRDGRAIGRTSVEGYDEDYQMGASVEGGPGVRAFCANAVGVALAQARIKHPYLDRIAVLDLFHNTSMKGTEQICSGNPSTLMMSVALRIDDSCPGFNIESSNPVANEPHIHVDAKVPSVNTASDVLQEGLGELMLQNLRDFAPQLLLINLSSSNLAFLFDGHEQQLQTVMDGTMQTLAQYTNEGNGCKMVVIVECAKSTAVLEACASSILNDK